MPKDVVARLDRCMYGTRDAGAIWEQCYADALVAMGFEQGKASPCCFAHPKWNVQVVVHGDVLQPSATAGGWIFMSKPWPKPLK